MKMNFKVLALLFATVAMLWACNPEQTPDDNKPNQDQPGNNETPGDTTDTPAADPVIEFADGGQLSAAWASRNISIGYTIKNPVEGGVLTVVIPKDATWITEGIANDSTINLTLEDNIESDSRNSVVSVVYKYGEKELKAFFNVIQEGVQYTYIHKIVASEFLWCGSSGGIDNTYSNFLINLRCEDYTTAKEDQYNICFDIYTAEKPEDDLPFAGVYTAAPNRKETDFTYSNVNSYVDQYSAGKHIFSAGFIAGECIIFREGDAFSIRALVTDEYENVHLIIYDTDDNEVIDATIESNLASDWIATVDGAAMEGMVIQYLGYTDNSYAYRFQIWPEYLEPKDYVFFGEFYTSKDIDIELTGIPNGYTLTLDKEGVGAPNTYSEGRTGTQGSWILQAHHNEGNMTYFGAQTPLKDGTITFTLNENGTYDIQLDVMDDNTITPHKVQILFKGTPVTFVQ